MKYVIFEDGLARKFPILFPESLSHDQVKIPNMAPISAGYVSTDLKAIGESTSLGLKPLPGDTERIQALVAGLESLMFIL